MLSLHGISLDEPRLLHLMKSIGKIKHIGCLFVVLIGSTGSFLAQPAVKVETPDKNLGIILWKAPVTVSYKLVNAGNEALVVRKIETSCACAVADWPKTTIAPRKSAEINVTYDAKQLGHFHKYAAVYTNADRQPVYLTFRGEVATEWTEDISSFPNQIGPIRLDRASIEFDEVNKGDRPSVELKVMNGSDGIYSPVLMHLPPYLSAEVTPEKIEKNRVGKIKVMLDSEKLPKLGLTTASVYLARYPGDMVGEENEIPISVVNLPDFSHLDVDRQEHPPVVTLSTKELEIGTMMETEERNARITITNTGKSKLEIQDLQVFNSALGVQLNRRILPPGKKAKLKITVYGNHLRKIKNTPRVLMITNDPNQPKVIIKVKVALNE